MVRQPLSSLLSIKSYDISQYFDNAAFYYMLYDFKDFKDFISLQPYISPQDNITLIDRFVILPEGIGKIQFDFEVNDQTKQIFLLGI